MERKLIDMKKIVPCLGGILLSLVGCATNVQTTLREPIGPSSHALVGGSTGGCLVVYSRWDPALHMDYDCVARAPYDVYAPDGKLVTHVFNDAGGYDRDPVQLSLPAGEYKVSSFVPIDGQTIVPVVIVPGQTTMVYLDGSGNRLRKLAPAGSLLRLPDGDVAGWRAGGGPSQKPSSVGLVQ